MYPLTKVALITGAGRPTGLGFATARALAQQGFHVAVTARTAEQAEERARELRDEGLSAEGFALDLSDTDAFAAVADRIRAAHGHLDALINNASVFPDMGTESPLDAPVAAIQAALDVDVVGPWVLTVALRTLLEAAPAARVVNVTSGAYQQITALTEHSLVVGAPAYSLAKYTVNVLTSMLAAAFAETKVLVNAVDPGRADTCPDNGTDEEDVPPAVAAKWIAWAATLPEGAPTGAIFLEGERVG